MRQLICALVIAAPLAAQAQPAGPAPAPTPAPAPSPAPADPKQAAQQHVVNATAAHQQEQFDVALKELEAAYALDPQPDLLFAMGQVQGKLDKCDLAIASYELFIASSPPADSAAAANEAITACRARIAAATPAPAEPAPVLETTVVAPAPEAEPATGIGILAGAKVGGIVPLDGLSPFVHFGVELGYVLPPLNRQLAIVVSVDYTQPTTTNVENDSRVMGGSYTWKLTEQELGVMATLMFRATSVKSVIPYGGIGPRILFARSKVSDNGAPMISITEEQSTRFGVGIPLGIELPLGPGRAIAEALFQYGTFDHVATGDAHSGAITVGLGYRMVL